MHPSQATSANFGEVRLGFWVGDRRGYVAPGFTRISRGCSRAHDSDGVWVERWMMVAFRRGGGGGWSGWSMMGELDL